MKNIIFCLIFILISFSSYSLEGLAVGSKAPSLSLTATSGESVKIQSENKKTIVVFYRGSWCPYCMRQLQSIEKEVVPKLGNQARLLAISVDKLSVAKKMKRKFNFSFEILSDPKAQSLKAFNITNQLSQKLVQKYKASYSIDVEGDSGETHHMVAHPAVFVIDKDKVIFADVHTDYKQRTDNNAILKALSK